MPLADPEARRKYHSEYSARRYREDEGFRARIISAASRNNVRLRNLNKAIILEAKSVPCTDCKIAYPSYVMDFDHVRGEKLGQVSVLANRPCSLEVLLAEIAKCDVVCANCHRRRTHG